MHYYSGGCGGWLQTKVFGGSDDDTAPDGDPVEGDAADEAAEDAPQEDE